MRRTRVAVLTACGVFLVWMLLSVVLLLYGNDWWLSGLTTLTIFAWFAGLLVVMFQQGRVRAAATGAVIAAAAYWLLALGPWFSTNVGPTLLTSRGLAHLDVQLHGPPQQTQTLAWTAPQSYTTSPVFVTGSGVDITNTIQAVVTPQALAFVNTATVAPGGSVFQALGQWLTIWLSAALGGLIALLMQMKSERKQPPASSSGAAS
jgi:hypothetical protein